MSDWSDLQEDIISEHRRDSSQSDAEIAAELGCSASYVNQTRNEYDEAEESSGGGLLMLAIVVVLVLFFIAQNGGT
ncbi:hypothetical protein I7X12_16755 [Halosimplex litoreum]|uniref:Uncharacterized protein n=1 Tax=Halosimplex litoreum TaxID=1198301 RepID=A0A7T3FXD3_9EURY|nr:hypothetical protein [Halosimplex litoreum]QPV62371.1 hypothetical protein I7X12_16755 [Halosimplex litoreum]